MAAMTVVTMALKVSVDISMSTHAPLNSNGFSVLKRKGSLMPSRASWSTSLYSLFRTFDTVSLKGSGPGMGCFLGITLILWGPEVYRVGRSTALNLGLGLGVVGVADQDP